MVLCEKQHLVSFYFIFFLFCSFWLCFFFGGGGVKKTWKEPNCTTGHWAKQLGIRRMHSCPDARPFVAPLTQWHVVLLLEVGLFGLCQLHTMHPYIPAAPPNPPTPTGTLISGLTWKEQDWHFSSWPHSWPDESPGIFHTSVRVGNENLKTFTRRSFFFVFFF